MSASYRPPTTKKLSSSIPLMHESGWVKDQGVGILENVELVRLHSTFYHVH
jgi:hypothetical protein